MTALQLLIFKYQFGNQLERAIARRELQSLGAHIKLFGQFDQSAKQANSNSITHQFDRRINIVSDNTKTAKPQHYIAQKTNLDNPRQTFIGPSNTNRIAVNNLPPVSIIDATKVNNGLGAFGMANGAKTVILEYAKGTGELCLAAGKYLKFCQKVNTSAALVGMAVTYYDGRVNNEWKNHHTADILIGASMMFLTGPVGWAFGGAYFITDIGFQCVYKKGITEYYLD